MPKKIYDVLPPKVAHKVENGIKELTGDKKKKHRKPAKKTSQFSWRPVIAVSGVLVLFLLIALFLKLPKANVQLWPKTEVLEYTQKVTIDKTAGSIDLDNNIIPALYLEEEKSGSQEFPATANATNEGKATGTITIYNKADPTEPFTLKSGTHFLSDSGKYFITLQKVVIPAGKKSGGKVTPGSLDVKVQAVEGGDSYNIGASKFVAPKLSGTAYYYSIYAESKKAMTGGFASKSKKVSEDDIQQAKTTLVKQLTTEASDTIKSKISAEYILLDSAVGSETISAQSETKAGVTAENFKYNADVKAKALIFKKADLEKIAKEYIISQLTDEQSMIESSLNMSYVADSINMDDGKGTVNVTFSVKAYDKVDNGSIIPLLKGKNGSQISDVINSNLGEEISKVKVNFWPFWVTKAPQNQKAIKIELKFE